MGVRDYEKALAHGETCGDTVGEGRWRAVCNLVPGHDLPHEEWRGCGTGHLPDLALHPRRHPDVRRGWRAVGDGRTAMTADRRRPEHTAARPSWRCRACGAPWPCSSARLRLLVEYRGNRPTLLIYLSTLMAEAAADLPVRPDDPASSDLALRFLCWASSR